MPIRFERYRIKDGDDANAAKMNPILRDLDVRLAGVEDKGISFDQERVKLTQALLTRTDELMLPIVDRLADFASLGAILTTTSDSSIEVSADRKVFLVDEGKRLQFAPSAYLAMIKTGDPEQAMLGSLVAYDPTTGELTIDVDRFAGGGFHEGWTITAASATDNAEAIPLVEAYKDAAEAAAGQATARRNEALAAAEAALGYRDEAEDHRDIAHAEAETADDARNQAQIAQAQTETARSQALTYMRGFLGVHPSGTPPTMRQDGSPLEAGCWFFKEVAGSPPTYYIDFVASVGPVVWRSLVAASDTSVTSFAGRVGGVNPTAGDYTGDMVDATAPGGLSGATVQAILDSIGTALGARALATRTVTGGGLVSGGGDLSANRTLTVTKSSQAQAEAGTDDSTAMTPVRVKDAILALAPAPAAASETVAGIVELATSAETITGTSTTLAIHPAGFKAAVDARFTALTGAAPGALDTLAELAAAIDNNASYASSITTALAGKLASSAYTAADVLSKLTGVDGAGSGLDADLLDGLQAAAFAQVGQINTFTTWQAFKTAAANGTQRVIIAGQQSNGAQRWTIGIDSNEEPVLWTYDTSGIYRNAFQFRLDSLYLGANAFWHAGNFTPGGKADTTTSISAGTGLSGGGSLAASRTLSFDVAWGDTRYALTGHTHAAATTSVAGFLSAADKTKLDGLVAGGPDYQAFTASGTWTKPAGLTGNEIVLVEEWGGGGGARQNGTDWQAVGGGGGEYRMFFLRAGDLSATESVTVGAGGAAGASGTAGGFSSFKGIEAAGGRGGQFGGAPGGATRSGNVATTVTTTMLGGAGYQSIAAGGEPGGAGAYDDGGGLHYLPQNTINSGGGGGSAKPSYRTGGTSVHGGAGGTSTGTIGAAGSAPGGGGAGGTTTAGNGARGEVRVTVLRS